MIFHQRFIPGLAIYSYLIGDDKTREAVVVDPTRDVEEYLRIARAEGLRITHVLETHVHADFISGAAELKARGGGRTRVHASGMGGKEWTPPYADHVVKDGDEITLGALRFRAVHTPGHTPEHLAWALYDQTRSKDVPWLILTGDFLFVGDVGRPDLLGEEARRTLAHQLYHSVFQVLPGLPDFTEVYPAHGAGSLCGKALGTRGATTVGFERRFNRALQVLPEPEWVASLLEGMPPAPPYFRRMKKVNAAGPRILGPELPGQRRLSPQEVQEHVRSGGIVLDVRAKEAFAAAHVPQAVNVPLAANLPTWAGWVLPYDVPIALVLDGPGDLAAVTTHLIRVGYDDVRGYLDGGIEAWETAGLPLGRVATLSVHELAKQRSAASAATLLDVRSDVEWQGGRVDGAVHVPLGELQQRLEEVPRGKPVAVICGSGYRASIAASLLKRAGHDEVANVVGGMTAWRAAGLPVTQAASGCGSSGPKCSA